MPYRDAYSGGEFVSDTPITRDSYIRPDRTYAPPAGYAAAGPQPANGATLRSYLEGVSAGRYHAGYANYLRGHGVIRRP